MKKIVIACIPLLALLWSCAQQNNKDTESTASTGTESLTGRQVNQLQSPDLEDTVVKTDAVLCHPPERHRKALRQ